MNSEDKEALIKTLKTLTFPLVLLIILYFTTRCFALSPRQIEKIKREDEIARMRRVKKINIEIESLKDRKNKIIEKIIENEQLLKNAKTNWKNLTIEEKINILSKAVFALIVNEIQEEEQ